jgi:hypothetical protein
VGSVSRRVVVQAGLDINSKITKAKGAKGMAQVVPNKHKTLSSNLNTPERGLQTFLN